MSKLSKMTTNHEYQNTVLLAVSVEKLNLFCANLGDYSETCFRRSLASFKLDIRNQTYELSNLSP